MGELILVYGKSGSGKSRSLVDFNEDEIFLVNTIGKRLPFSKKFKYEIKPKGLDQKGKPADISVATIKEGLKKMPCKIAVIDDGGYLQTNLFMSGHGKGDQFALYNSIGDTMWDLFNFIKYGLEDDKTVYFMMHEEENDYGATRLRTLGKLLDSKVCLEGMVTVCLHAVAKSDGKHVFVTNSNGNDVCKSPEGLFPMEIENTLKGVDILIRAFWGLPPSREGEE